MANLPNSYPLRLEFIAKLFTDTLALAYQGTVYKQTSRTSYGLAVSRRDEYLALASCRR